MTLGFRDIISDLQFDASELSWANNGTTALPAGTYNFTMLRGDFDGLTREDGAYQFSISQPIPVGGGFRHTSVGSYYASTELYVPANIIGSKNNHLQC